MKELGEIESGSDEYLEWSAVGYPVKGESICGDDYLIIKHRQQMLVAVVDGLGHGKEARNASGKALEQLTNYQGESLISLMNRCHEALRETRGVVMSMAIFDNADNTMSWMGVGNVEGILFRASEKEETPRETILLRGGVVGYKLPQLKASILTIQPGDTLVFTTDGVSYGYSKNINISQSTEELTNYISSDFVDYSDDALILVARYKVDKNFHR